MVLRSKRVKEEAVEVTEAEVEVEVAEEVARKIDEM